MERRLDLLRLDRGDQPERRHLRALLWGGLKAKPSCWCAANNIHWKIKRQLQASADHPSNCLQDCGCPVCCPNALVLYYDGAPGCPASCETAGGQPHGATLPSLRMSTRSALEQGE